MKALTRKVQILFTGVFTLVLVLINCRVMRTETISTLTEVEIENMARRATPATGAAGAPPELPRVVVDTKYVPPTGQVIAVPAGGDFQAAIDRAKPGDVITLQAGATYTGTFTLPAKTGSGWIVIRTSAPDSSLPPSGTRITPAYANVLPKIVTPESAAALTALSGAHHYRLIGLEFTQAAGVTQTYSLIELGDGQTQTSLAQLPHDLILDRLYIHGRPTTTLRRGVTLNSATTAIIDSYLADCHEEGADSQAIGGWNGPGPFKIENNYLEGAGENIIFGGADPVIQNLVPSDIEIRRNYCFKPFSWKIGHPSYAGIPWGVKNLFELKNAQRVLIDGNTFENNWVHAQNGFAILFTVRNQDGTAPWSVVQDVTFTNNIVKKVGAGFNMHGRDNNFPSMLTKRVRISNNLLVDVIEIDDFGPGIAFQMNSGLEDVTIEHNTVFQTNTILAAGGDPNPRLIFNNNILRHNQYGVKGDGKGTGQETIDAYFPASEFRKNVMLGGPSADYPAENFFPASIDLIRFVNFAGGNYRLAPDSPYKKAGTDGKDIGCDIDALEAAQKQQQDTLSSVSAASYNNLVAPDSIAAAFGTGLSPRTAIGTTSPLPTVLEGSSLKLLDSAGIERLCPLFLVSPTQFNYLVPIDTALGTATASVINGTSVVASGRININATAPGLFTANASGSGLPAAAVLRYKSGSSTPIYEMVARYDAASNTFVAVPVDVSNQSDQVFLVLFGTGFGRRQPSPPVTAKIGGTDSQVTFAGSQGVLFGLDQVNIRLPGSLAGRGDVDVLVTLGQDQTANAVRINMK